MHNARSPVTGDKLKVLYLDAIEPLGSLLPALRFDCLAAPQAAR